MWKKGIIGLIAVLVLAVPLVSGQTVPTLVLGTDTLIIPPTGSTELDFSIQHNSNYTTGGSVDFSCTIEPEAVTREIANFGTSSGENNIVGVTSSGEIRYSAQYLQFDSKKEIHFVSIHVYQTSFSSIELPNFQLSIVRGFPNNPITYIENVTYQVPSGRSWVSIEIENPVIFEANTQYSFIFKPLNTSISNVFYRASIGDDNFATGRSYTYQGTSWFLQSKDMRMIIIGIDKATYVITSTSDNCPFLNISLSPLYFAGSSPHNFIMNFTSNDMKKGDSFDVVINVYDGQGKAVDTLRISNDPTVDSDIDISVRESPSFNLGTTEYMIMGVLIFALLVILSVYIIMRKK